MREVFRAVVGTISLEKTRGTKDLHWLCFCSRLEIRRVRDENQTPYAENLLAQYGISATSNIPPSPGVDLDPRKYGEPGSFPQY